MLKKILTISAIVLAGIGLLALSGFAYHLHSNERISEVIIKVSPANDGGFVTAKQLSTTINPKDTLLTRRIKEIDEQAIEEQLIKNVFLEHVDCFTGLRGEIFVYAKERAPIVRVYEKNQKSYYIDENGSFFPVHPSYAPRVIIANGYLNNLRQQGHENIYDTIYRQTPLFGMFNLIKKIRSDSFFNAQISQIYLNSIGEWELVPEFGEHLILLGDLSNLEEKLENLYAFYHEVSQNNDWEKYQLINLKYKNQIVCTKK
ncbi:MAG: cell division protein FtsQ/DivIB [Bacteroidales bacterium]|nr:cell division protein FtsQ/DivIB [Bacteroidales bacterium]